MASTLMSLKKASEALVAVLALAEALRLVGAVSA